MGTTTSTATAAQPQPPGRAGFWGSRLSHDDEEIPWLWQGYLAAGQITLLTSQWKSGKTTLLSVLLSRLRQGGSLAGLPVAQAKAVVVSEESSLQWRPRHAKLDLGHVFFYCRPFPGKPTADEWLGLLEDIAQRRRQDGVALAAIDTLATFLPGGNEASADSVLKALLPLQRLTELGMSVLLTHHPRKGTALPGQAARGSGAFAAFADIVVEMSRGAGIDDDDRRRRLLGFSRSELTPRQLVLQLNAEATDYTALGDFRDDDFAVHWQRLRLVLADAAAKLTRRQILDDWPADFPRPADSTLWTWLERACNLGQLRRQGSGRKTDPFRYWLPDQEQVWQQDPMLVLEQLLEDSHRQVLRDLAKPP